MAEGQKPGKRDKDRDRDRSAKKRTPSAKVEKATRKGDSAERKRASAPPKDGSQAPLMAALLAVVVVGALFFSFGGLFPPKWEEFVDAGGGFSVLAPGFMSSKDEQVDGKDGQKITVHLFICSDDVKKRAYSANWTDYPETVFDKTVDQILDGARDGTVDKIKGKLRDSRSINLDSAYPGREFRAEVDGAIVVSRIYVVKRRLYQTIVVAPVQDEKDPEIAKFLDSFRLTGR